jgi:ABC-type protease/lipase transport system fused ATPase/permease subunit
MRLTTLLFGFILSLSTFSAIAGSGHDHDHGHSHSYAPVNQDKAQSNAAEIVAALVKRNKLEKNWESIKASSVEKITVQDNSEWLVVFVNKSITDVKKQKLYVFLTFGGDYIAANFTGK